MSHHDGSGLKVATAHANDVARQRRKKALLAIATWVIAFAVVFLFCCVANAQSPYKVLPLNKQIEEDPDRKALKTMESAAKQVAQSRDLSLVKNINAARYYFEKYIPAKITQPNGLSQVNEYLSDVRTKLSGAQRANAPGAVEIMRWMYSGLKPIAQGNFHPAARISAISFLSQMDVAMANRAQQTPPTPAPFIPTDFLPIYANAKNADGVRAAALHGLHRYAMYAAPRLRDPVRGQLIKEMKTLLNSEPPEGRDEQAHAYLQRFAIDILSYMRSSADPELGKTLISISTEAKNPDLIALHSAASIGGMSADLQGNVGPTNDVLNNWTARAMMSFKYEIARLNALQRPRKVPGQPVAADSMATTKKDENKPTPGAMGMEMGMGMDPSDMMDGMDMMEDMESEMMGMDGMEGMEGMMGMGMGMGMVQANPQPPEVKLSRRKLNHVLQQLHQGVSGSGTTGEPSTPGGLLAAVGDAEKPLIVSWLTGMKEVVTALNDVTLDTRDKYLEALDAQAKVLQQMAGEKAAAAAEEVGVKLPGVVGPVKTEPVPVVVPTEPTLDASGAPTFPAGDELSE